MIASLRGTVARLEANFVVLEVGGVGYKVFVPVSALLALPPPGETAHLHVFTRVLADDISLFGFVSPDDQKIFELLLSVSGVGPKVALSVLSAMDAESLARAVATEDAKLLVRIPGLGLKTAQRLILELRDKLAALVWTRKVDQMAVKSQRTPDDDILGDVVEGLVYLGHNRISARKAAEAARKSLPAAEMRGLLKAANDLLTGNK